MTASQIAAEQACRRLLDAAKPLVLLMSDYGFEPVLFENDWWDGPRLGLAWVHGVLSYFEREFDSEQDEYTDVFQAWPAAPEAVEWEREHWAIFADWNHRFEAGEATADAHPGHGGIDARYDELETLLQPHRIVPENARRFHVQWRFTQVAHRYHRHGVDYHGLWHLTTS